MWGEGGGAMCRELGQEGKPAARNSHAVCRHDYAIDLTTAGTQASLTQVDTRAAGGNRGHCRLLSIKLRAVMQQVRTGSIKLRTVMQQMGTRITVIPCRSDLYLGHLFIRGSRTVQR